MLHSIKLDRYWYIHQIYLSLTYYKRWKKYIYFSCLIFGVVTFQQNVLFKNSFFSVKYLKAFCIINFIVLCIALVLIHGIMKLSEYLEANKNIFLRWGICIKFCFELLMEGLKRGLIEGEKNRWEVSAISTDYNWEKDLIIPHSKIPSMTLPLPTLIKIKLIKTSFIQTTLI